MSYLLAISVGPVQEFIVAARRTRDLWFGSYLLSVLPLRESVPRRPTSKRFANCSTRRLNSVWPYRHRMCPGISGVILSDRPSRNAS
jgi:hypothetical protein